MGRLSIRRVYPLALEMGRHDLRTLLPLGHLISESRGLGTLKTHHRS
jgi:hypothetical protein